jgi:hypothetical protein
MAAVLPAAPQVVTSTDPTPGDVVSYTLDVTGPRAGEFEVVTEMVASLTPGVTIVRSPITIVDP